MLFAFQCPSNKTGFAALFQMTLYGSDEHDHGILAREQDKKGKMVTFLLYRSLTWKKNQNIGG